MVVVALQMKLNDVSNEQSEYADQLFVVLSLIMQYPEGSTRLDQHSCQNPDTDQFSDCIRCQQAAFLYQIVMQLTELLCPKEEAKLDYADLNHSDWLAEAQLSESNTTASNMAASCSNPGSPRNPAANMSTGAVLSPGAPPKESPASLQYLQVGPLL